MDVALLLRGIFDDSWQSTLKHQASNLMQYFPQDGSVGLNADIIKEALLSDMDADLLSDTIGRELASRLRRSTADLAGLSLDLKFRGIELVPGHPMRVLRMTASASDVAAIYSWLHALIPIN
ncbi:hypothetical protein [Bradyrhizobium sp. S3.5.5]|uniref:hypothetical protein n=1 Tax=Bradyrhizobium sp. S3.5.5 TaxID=3156430 RepID=UPI00339A8E66